MAMTIGLGRDPKIFEFRCPCCGDTHRGSPSFAYDRPLACFFVPQAERADRIEIDDDMCAIDGDEFYIRVTLEIPIHGVEDPFCLGVWVSQSKESFTRYAETFAEDQSELGSFGWLAVTMPGYDRTGAREDFEHIACDVEWQGPGLRPTLALHECDHPLYRDFTDGISWQRAVELALAFMHPPAG